jgi:hypothetical protein
MIPEIYTQSFPIINTGEMYTVRRDVQLATGQKLVRGSVLGQITLGTATAAVKTGGNTGGQTIGGVSAKSKTSVGVYQVRCVTAGAAAVFSVVGPDGSRLADAQLGTAYANQYLGFTITASGAAPVVGDGFDITIPAGSGQYQLVNSANVDGSNVAAAVLVEDVDTTNGVQIHAVFMTGEFNANALTFGGTDTWQTHFDEMQRRNMYIRPIY